MCVAHMGLAVRLVLHFREHMTSVWPEERNMRFTLCTASMTRNAIYLQSWEKIKGIKIKSAFTAIGDQCKKRVTFRSHDVFHTLLSMSWWFPANWWFG